MAWIGLAPSRTLWGLLACLLASCTFDGASLPGPMGDTYTVEFTSDPSGNLVNCSSGEPCQTLSNPEGCAKYQLSVDAGGELVCERCEDDAGNTLRDTCNPDEVTAVCTVVKAPDPDCLVCSIQNGPVVLSTCESDGPIDCIYYDEGVPFRPSTEAPCASDSDCGRGEICAVGDAGSVAGTCVPNCKVCLDSNGRSVLTECPGDCAQVACPEVACGPGFAAVRRPGECCEACIPVADCSNAACPFDVTVPDCPGGTELRRDPTDCCLFICEPISCMGMVPTDPAATCPVGYRWDAEFPSCGQCVLEQEVYCTTNSDCPLDAFCTTTVGACEPCAPGTPCSNGCTGVCRPDTPANCDDSFSVPTAACDGQWLSPGTGPDGCPIPPVCICVDGVTSFDGNCTDQCASVECPAAATVCEDGYVFVDDYPYCCGTCVLEEDTCTLASGEMVVCPQESCGPGFHPEPDPNGCCDTCVPDTVSCTANSACGMGEICSTELGECEPTPDPSCSGPDCPTVCGGMCIPENSCLDSDGGFNFRVKGNVRGRYDDGLDYEDFLLEDYCESPNTLIEHWCFDDPSGAPGRRPGVVQVECEHGCMEGRCLPGDNAGTP